MNRIRQFAAAREIPLPADLQIFNPGSDVAPELASLVGIWGGDSRWNGRGRQPIVIVERILPPNKAVVVYTYGPPNQYTYNQAPPKWWRGIANVTGNTVDFEYYPGFDLRVTVLDNQRAYAVIMPNLRLKPPFPGSRIWLTRLS